jgi:surfactin synthase thioesterase subunit
VGRPTSGAFDVQVFAGGNFFLTEHTDALIKLLDQHFDGERGRVAAR